MTFPNMMQPHPSDGEIIALIDGELIAQDTWVESHVAQCDECSARVSLRRDQSAMFKDALSALPEASVLPDRIWPGSDDLARARRRVKKAVWQRPAFRAAAGILLLAGAAAASPVVRSWIGDQVTRLRSAPATVPEEKRTNNASESLAVADPAVASVGFAVAGQTLSVRLRARPARGSLTIVSGSFERARADATGISPEESFLVLPGELQIGNHPRSVANYLIRIPRHVRSVRLIVGTEKPRVFTLTPGDRIRDIPL